MPYLISFCNLPKVNRVPSAVKQQNEIMCPIILKPRSVWTVLCAQTVYNFSFFENNFLFFHFLTEGTCSNMNDLQSLSQRCVLCILMDRPRDFLIPDRPDSVFLPQTQRYYSYTQIK